MSSRAKKPVPRRRRPVPKLNQAITSVPRWFGNTADAILPNTYEAWVTYQFNFNLINAGGESYAYPFYTNAPYDVNPALGSTSTQGHSELSTLYGKCRVIHYDSLFECVNTGNFPVMITVLHRNTNVSSAGGSAVDLSPYAGNAYVQHVVLGHYSASSAHRTLRAHRTISQIVGSNAPRISDDYASLVSAVPTNLTFVEIGAKLHDPTGVTNLISPGIDVTLTLRMFTQYYERKQLTT